VTEEAQVITVGVERLWSICFGEMLNETTDQIKNSHFVEGLTVIGVGVEMCWAVLNNRHSAEGLMVLSTGVEMCWAV
jgi:hypothetical protein